MFFQEISIPSPWRLIGNSKVVGWGSKAQVFKGMYKLEMEFPGGGAGVGLKPKINPLWEGYNVFRNNTFDKITDVNHDN